LGRGKVLRCRAECSVALFEAGRSQKVNPMRRISILRQLSQVVHGCRSLQVVILAANPLARVLTSHHARALGCSRATLDLQSGGCVAFGPWNSAPWGLESLVMLEPHEANGFNGDTRSMNLTFGHVHTAHHIPVSRGGNEVVTRCPYWKVWTEPSARLKG